MSARKQLEEKAARKALPRFVDTSKLRVSVLMSGRDEDPSFSAIILRESTAGITELVELEGGNAVVGLGGPQTSTFWALTADQADELALNLARHADALRARNGDAP